MAEKVNNVKLAKPEDFNLAKYFTNDFDAAPEYTITDETIAAVGVNKVLVNNGSSKALRLDGKVVNPGEYGYVNVDLEVFEVGTVNRRADTEIRVKNVSKRTFYSALATIEPDKEGPATMADLNMHAGTIIEA